MTEPRVARRYVIDDVQRPYTVELHLQGCDCPACEPYVPSVPRPMTHGEIARWAATGLAAGHAIACLLLGPAAVLHQLRDTFAWWLL